MDGRLSREGYLENAILDLEGQPDPNPHSSVLHADPYRIMGGGYGLMWMRRISIGSRDPQRIISLSSTEGGGDD
jgi:hypothetical protein